MLRSRHCLWLGLLLAAVAVPLGCTQDSGGAGDAGAQGKRIILLTNGNSPFWDACRVGLLAAAEEFKLEDEGLRAVMEVNDGTPKGQVDKLRQFYTQRDIVAVAVSALDADNPAVAEEMKRLAKRGVLVICVDADVNREKFRGARSYYIGTDNVRGGRALGIAARKLLEARGVTEGSYVQFVGRTGSHNARERMDGFKEKVGEQYREAGREGDDLNLARARDNVRNAITNQQDLVALVGIWSYNAPAIVDVVLDRDVRNRMTIATFDAEPSAVKYMGEGEIDVMVVQNPYDMGYQAVRLLRAMLAKDDATITKMFPNQGQPDGDLFETGLRVVVPDENSPLSAELFDEMTEFMTLPQFREWLGKYNLTGS